MVEEKYSEVMGSYNLLWVDKWTTLSSHVCSGHRVPVSSKSVSIFLLLDLSIVRYSERLLQEISSVLQYRTLYFPNEHRTIDKGT